MPFLLKRVSRPPTTSNRPKTNHSQTSPLRSRVLYVKENTSRKASSFIPPYAMNYVEEAVPQCQANNIFAKKLIIDMFQAPISRRILQQKNRLEAFLSSAKRFQYEMQTKNADKWQYETCFGFLPPHMSLIECIECGNNVFFGNSLIPSPSGSSCSACR